MDQSVIRNINLIEVLWEEAESAGRQIQELPNDAAFIWSEDQIRKHFQGGSDQSDSQNNAATSAAPFTTICSVEAQSAYPDPPEHVFQTWFPGLSLSKTVCANPRWRVLCFCNAGSAEDMYTSEGSGPRRAASPLLDWCRANKAECLAVQPPGRNMRRQEQPITSAPHLAAMLLPVVASRLTSVPYVIVAHSVGTWVAYEFMQAARQAGIPMPRHAFLSAMAAPDIPLQQRPWRRQATLDDSEFQEECRTWDVNEVVFSPAMWPTYQPLMRADFQLFDEYEFSHAGQATLDVAFTLFHGASDHKISRELLDGWQRLTTKDCSFHTIDGNHLWPLQKAAKTQWLSLIVSVLDTLAL